MQPNAELYSAILKGDRQAVHRLKCRQVAFDGGNKEIWPAIIDWMMDSMNRLEKAIRPSLLELAMELKQSGMITEGEEE